MSRAMAAEGTAPTLARIAAYDTDVRIGIILKLCECFSAIVLAVAFYELTRDTGHELAVLGLICRVAEGLFIASLIPSDLGLLWLAGPGASAGEPTTANLLAAFQLRPELPMGTIFFAVGSSVFSYLLLSGRLVPVWLAAWGMFSSLLLVIGFPLQLAGLLTGPLTQYA